MTKVNKEKKANYGLIMVVYLLGIFMGALDTGIVTPARTVIQESLGVSDTAGIWMITIYTLAYAAAIPVMGKLADRLGRRSVYLVAILLFGGGSFLCGVSHIFNSFPALLGARCIQAIGGGGIVPIANAEFGTTFPEEKRGMALGMVGGVYGIANIFGASAGSLVMDIFGTDRWEFIFYVNVPIAVFILIAGFFCLPNTKDKASSKIDGLGTMLLVLMVLSLLYGIKNIDFFDFIATVTSTKVWPFLLVFVALLPVFIWAEGRAEDPVLNLKLFTNRNSLVTLLVSAISGVVMMGVIFVPQMCENAMEVPTGSGGYFVIALGITAGIGAMSSGKLTDKYGPKLVLMIGFIASIISALIIIFFVTRNPNIISVFGGLLMIGFAIGFTMGAPLNYMMLGEVAEHDANSGLATLALVRSLGTVIAPAIMVGFISHAGMNMQDNLMGIMPDQINVPELPYAEELMDMMDEQDMDMGDMPDLDEMKTIKIDMSDTSDSDFEIPDEILDEMMNSDVTTIMNSVKHMSEYFFDEMQPEMTAEINDGIDKGIAAMNDAVSEMQKGIDGISKGRRGIKKGIDGISSAIKGQTKGVNGMKQGRAGIQQGIDGIQKGVDGMRAGLDQMQAIVDRYNALPDDDPQKAILAGQIPDIMHGMQQIHAQLDPMEEQLKAMKAERDDMTKKINNLQGTINKLTKQRNKMINQRAEMADAIREMKSGIADIKDAQWKMGQLKAALPDAFAAAQADYIDQLDAKEGEIKKCYQDTLNVGFRQMFELTACASVVGILLLLMYRKKKA